jgi:hypothetical protein
VLPKTYEIFNSTLLKGLLKKVCEMPAKLRYGSFGRIYEYFLGEFARTDGQKDGDDNAGMRTQMSDESPLELLLSGDAISPDRVIVTLGCIR